jgi:hypothetical protein
MSRYKMTFIFIDRIKIAFEQELKKLIDGYNLKTQTIGGACDRALQYRGKKARKNYEKTLHPKT